MKIAKSAAVTFMPQFYPLVSDKVTEFMEREGVCAAVWEEAINYNSGWIEAYLNSTDQSDESLRLALQAMIDRGIDIADLVRFAEAARYEAAFATLRILAENGTITEEFDCLYEDLLTSRPEM